MANPISIPGTVVPSGSLISPGGAQGVQGLQGSQGPQGPTAISAFIAKTAAYTLTTADSGKYVICSGGSWTLTLPAPASGLAYQVRNDMGISGTTGTITLQPTGGTIDGLASIALLPQQECTLLTDGSNWRTYGLKREVILGTQDITSSTAGGTILLPVGYRYLELEFTNFLPVTNPDYLAAQLSNNGGSSWVATGYYHGYFYNPSTTAAAFFATENGTGMQINPYCAAGGLPGQARLTLYPGGFATWRFEGVGRTGSTTVKWNGGGWTNAVTGPVNALRYYAAGGNIASCLVTVKGVV